MVMLLPLPLLLLSLLGLLLLLVVVVMVMMAGVTINVLVKPGCKAIHSSPVVVAQRRSFKRRSLPLVLNCSVGTLNNDLVV